MTEEEIDEKEREYREGYPQAFSHTEARPGEACMADLMCDAVLPQLASYHGSGLLSARPGNNYVPQGGIMTYTPIFANIREYIVIENAHEKSKTAA